jgi:hypothetical protein
MMITRSYSIPNYKVIVVATGKGFKRDMTGSEGLMVTKKYLFIFWFSFQLDDPVNKIGPLTIYVLITIFLYLSWCYTRA